MIGTSFAAITQTIATFAFVPGDSNAQKIAYVAAAIATILFATNLVLSFFLPEPAADAIESDA